MYAAKEAGRNAYRFYTADMNARVQLRLQLETDMRRGLMDDEFFLVYQPQIDMQTGRACGVEALLRWRDPERGIIGPAEFIPDRRGVGHDPGARARGCCATRAGRWCSGIARACCCGCRSTCRCSSCSTTAGCRSSRKRCDVSGLAARYLDLEITESVIITHPDKAVATLMQAEADRRVDHDRRFRHRLFEPVVSRAPADPGRQDRPALRRTALEQNKNDEAITQAIIALSHSLGLRVIAEGVETAAQFEFLKTHGCEEAQGFLISPPLDPEALARPGGKRTRTTK